MDVSQLETDMENFNKVKELVVGQLINEGFINEKDGLEFMTRCQVLVYKGNWFSRWFDKNMKDKNRNNYYIRIIEMTDKQTLLDDLIK